jgi:hypothetical protein
MRRIMLLVTVALVMVAMMLATAAPGLARAIVVRDDGDVQGEEFELHGVRTLSDDTNVQCHIKPGDGNEGDSGGGATVDTRVGLEETEEGELVPARAHLVRTPSGNVILQGYLYPDD